MIRPEISIDRRRTYIIKQTLLSFIFFTIIMVGRVEAQIDSIVPVKRSHFNNIVKLNVAGLLVGSISLQDEVVFQGPVTAAIGLNIGVSALFLPKYMLPDSNVKFSDMNISGFSITPEVRYYTSGKPPKGFYIAPYFRYSNYTLSNLKVNYTNSLEQETSAILQGKYKQVAGGVMIGTQSKSGKHFVLDWWIIGLAIGKGTLDLSAPGQYSQKDIDDMTNNLHSVSTKIDVSGSDATMIRASYETTFSGRIGFAIGYIF